MFDSLGITHPNVFKTLRDYLVDEAREKRGMNISKDDLHGVYAKVPKQSNFCDCGVFLLHYVEKFLEHPDRYLPDILVPPQTRPPCLLAFALKFGSLVIGGTDTSVESLSGFNGSRVYATAMEKWRSQ